MPDHQASDSLNLRPLQACCNASTRDTGFASYRKVWGYMNLNFKLLQASRNLGTRDTELATARSKVCALEGVRVALVAEVERLEKGMIALREELRWSEDKFDVQETRQEEILAR